MRFSVSAMAMLGLAACAPQVPDSAAGVGFDDYNTYQQSREAQLTGQGYETVLLPAGAAESGADGTALAAPPANAGVNNLGISDEQSFSAVSSRETIESDRARLEAQRAQYEFIEPTALPQRSGGNGPNIVEYAVSTTNRVGQSVYRRSGRVSAESLARNCARYSSSDLAQEAFLKAGGPEKDPKRLDPDGDGFACYWDPTPFRLARGG